ncbi:hypothetical protein BgiBS90_019227 [Biomphalaria glabrata]|nr:hypothetical protein BgiBS90_019227 [Biomphalaria glabrata]
MYIHLGSRKIKNCKLILLSSLLTDSLHQERIFIHNIRSSHSTEDHKQTNYNVKDNGNILTFPKQNDEVSQC